MDRSESGRRRHRERLRRRIATAEGGLLDAEGRLGRRRTESGCERHVLVDANALRPARFMRQRSETQRQMVE